MELHIIFFILAGLLIAVLVGFSLWSARREKSRIFTNAFATRQPSVPISGKAVSDIPASLNPQAYQPQASPFDTEQPSAEVGEDNSGMAFRQEVESSLRDIKISLPGQQAVPTDAQAAPIYGNQPEPQTTPFQTQPTAQMQAEVVQVAPMQTVQLKTEPVRAAQSFSQAIKPTPSVSVLEQSVEELERQAEQGEVDIYSDASVRVELAKNSVQATPKEEAEEPAVQNDIVTLYVVAPEGRQFRGDTVVQSLEALGFQYGEYKIFHRHQHLGNSASPVIFSVANMMQPGVFDLANINYFSTVGLVLFMHLPSEGNDTVNLKLLLKATESLAQSLGGFVLNERREIFDEASRQAYFERVS